MSSDNKSQEKKQEQDNKNDKMADSSPKYDGNGKSPFKSPSLSKQLQSQEYLASLSSTRRPHRAPEWLEDYVTPLNQASSSSDSQGADDSQGAANADSQASDLYIPGSAVAAEEDDDDNSSSPTRRRKLGKSTPKKRQRAADDKNASTPKRTKKTPTKHNIPLNNRPVAAAAVMPLFGLNTAGLTPVGNNNMTAQDMEAALERLLAKPSPTEISGLVAPQHWQFVNSCKELDQDVKNQVLKGCFYEPGIIMDGSPQPTVEICFCFDTTGSMFQCIDELKFQLQSICNHLLSDLPAIRISMIAFGDYCDADVFYVVKKMDFTNDIETIQKFVKSLKGTGGGDPEEAAELALMEAQKLSWSKHLSSCAKVLVMIGDDVPHPQPLSMLGIDWLQEFNTLKQELSSEEHKFTAYAIQCLKRGRYADEFYQALADNANGSRYELENFASITEVFMGLCYRSSAEVQLAKHMDQIAAQQNQQSSNGSASSSSSSAPAIVNKPKKIATTLNDEEMLKIHTAIHDPTQENVEIRGTRYEIAPGNAGCRFTKIDNITFIEQNKEKRTKYAKMAIEGKHITWLVSSGNWGLIIDSEIVRAPTLADSQDGNSQPQQ